MKVEIWSDIVCPWCYMGKVRFEKALAEFEHRDEVQVEFRSFELDPNAARDPVPTEDLLATKFGMSAAQAQDALQQMVQRAATDGLVFRPEGQQMGNTRDAHRLLHLAREYGVQTELAERLHRAHFTEQRSIFDHASLTAIATEAGVPEDRAREVLASNEYTDGVTQDQATARQLGANGVPFFVLDRRFAISGAQGTESILGVLRQAWAQRADAPNEGASA